MNFNDVIVNLIEETKDTWNNRDIEKFTEYFEDDIVAHIEPVTLNQFFVKRQTVEGKDNVMQLMRELGKKLPLKYDVEYDPNNVSKIMHYRKYLYEIKVWAYFECTISKYGKYSEFKITKYENNKLEKLSTFTVVKNVALYKLRSMLSS